MLDLRTPSGWFFALLGAILVILGVFTPGLRAALTDLNVNLYCGLVMLAFGGVMLVLARTRP
jgi:predicted phage tail protein